MDAPPLPSTVCGLDLTAEGAQAVLDAPAEADAETLLRAMGHPSYGLVVRDVCGDGLQHARDASREHPTLGRQVPPERWAAADMALLPACAVGPVDAARHGALVERVHQSLWGPLAPGNLCWLMRPDVVPDDALPALLDHIGTLVCYPDDWLVVLTVEAERRGRGAVERRLAGVHLGALQALIPDLPADLVGPALTHPRRLEGLDPHGEEAARLYGLVRKHLVPEPDPTESLALVRFAPGAWWAVDLVRALHRVHGDALFEELSDLPEMRSELGGGRPGRLPKAS